ncbi:hypothetical protein HY214_03630 [Candidatus Roizmanbacteria bacterium]|nr:hypothetical protein [Candidatus Roizmanbacteria bacterium]
MADEVKNTKEIKLSKLTQALLTNFTAIKKKTKPDDHSRLTVSQTVSFFAIVYERIRNAVEYREEHLIRRSAIERILKRRLILNPAGRGEAENLLRELLWARYFEEGSLGVVDIERVQKMIDQYVLLRTRITTGQVNEKKAYYTQFLFDLLTCEIEEALDPEDAQTNLLFTSYLYQVLRQRFKIEKTTEEHKDAFLYVATERAFAKSDAAYLRYHLFNLSYKPLSEITADETSRLLADIPATFLKIENIIKNPFVDRLTKYVKRQMPSFLVLFNIMMRNPGSVEAVLTSKDALWQQVDTICREKYQQTSGRLRNLAVRSLIYIFLTKMLLALILEYPLSLYLFNEVNYFAIAVNSLFPPLLMMVIILFVRIPGEENTRRINSNIIDIVDADQSFEKDVAYVVKAPRVRKPVLVFGFTIFYSLTFLITLGIIYEVLTLLNFNYISDLLFIFFVSVVSFFGYRVAQIAKEYRLPKKESFFTPFADFFFMPILSLGKFFSSEIARLNFFIVVLDFLIEAPFKLIFEVVEEWIAFVRARKEEII